MKFQGSKTTPTGTVLMYGGSTAPAGWLFCDGSPISRSTYASLFTILGTTYGAGDGSTTFNLPNTQGVFIRGAGSQNISGITYSGTRGTSQADQFQGHAHNVDTIPATSGDVTGTIGRGSGVPQRQANTGVANVNDGSNGTPRYGSETRPANIVFNYMIKT